MPAVGAGSDPEPLAPGAESGGQRARTLRGSGGRFWRGAAPRIEQSVDGDSGKRGTSAGGGPQEKGRQTPAGRRTAPGNDCGAGGAFARDGATPEPGMGSAAKSRALRVKHGNWKSETGKLKWESVSTPSFGLSRTEI